MKRPTAPPTMPSRPPLPKSASISSISPVPAAVTKSSSDIQIDLSGLTMGSRSRNLPTSISSSALNTENQTTKPEEISVGLSGLMLGSKARNHAPPPIPSRRADSISSGSDESNTSSLTPASNNDNIPVNDVQNEVKLSPHNPFAAEIDNQKTSASMPPSRPGPPPIPSRTADTTAGESGSKEECNDKPVVVINPLASIESNATKIDNPVIPIRTPPVAQPRVTVKPTPPAIPSRSAVGAPEIPSRSAVPSTTLPASTIPVTSNPNTSKPSPPPIPQRNYLNNDS